MSRALPVVAALILLSALVVALGAWTDRSQRAGGPEQPLVAYAAALQAEDLRDALDQLVPELRSPVDDFVQWQLGNRYVILESAVRSDSLEERLLGRAKGRTTLVAVMEIQEAGVTWRTTEEIPVENRDGRWYLLKVPLK